MRKPNPEIMQKFMMFEQQVRHLQSQLEAVERAVVDMNSLNIGLDEMKGATGKEILAPIGRGIFAKAQLLSEELLVDIGDKNFVKKNISDTQKIIEEQIQKLDDVKKELNQTLEKLSQEMTQMILEEQGKEK